MFLEPIVAKRAARMMMHDAFETVSREHTGLTKHFLSNKAKTFVAKWSTESKVSMGTGVAVAVGVTIAGIATGGIAIPVLIALAAGTYALRNAIELIGADHRRANRNWLRRFPSAKQASEMGGVFLTVEAGDALRRAVDHFRMMKTILQEVDETEGRDFANCEQAINYVKAVSRFIHHSDKVRNYALPVLDLLIFYLDAYAELTKEWAMLEQNISSALQLWFEQHTYRCCCAGGGEDVCYAPPVTGPLAMPAKRHAEAISALPASFEPAPAAPGSPGAVKISELLEGMKAARDKIVAGMHASDSASWNYSAEQPVMTRVRAGAPAADHMHRRRLEALIDAVWRQVDRPGYFARATRRAGHWYTRTTGSEKIGAVIGEALAVGSIFLPFIGEANELTRLGQSAVSGSMTAAVLVGDKVGLNLLKGADGIAIKSSLLDHRLVEKHATDEIREAGAGVEKLMSKLMLHFRKAAEAVKSLDEASRFVSSCNDAMALSTKVAEIVSQMEKVSRYAGPCIGIADVLCNHCYAWTVKERAVWEEMETSVAEWLRDDAGHEHCRIGRTKCYGTKHHYAGGNFLGRGGTWVHITNDPHNPMT
ncbi:hypothetical protein [Paraburkholderia fungorum]|uniref:Uncharacterized protein n=1 Tax=Paraburkholderia fungorum TaxID=134537 RepID=A0A3R7HPP6_9BURK|nr:hypothetical protein [Paraburkholderia fungorum]RKF46718.1 hypothetical protein BCY88_03725 [Paraburkholderia fungorum]